MESTTELFKIPYDEGCKHCPNNPHGEKPFVKMKHFPKTAFTKEMLKKLKEKYNVNEECVICVALKDLINRFKP